VSAAVELLPLVAAVESLPLVVVAAAAESLPLATAVAAASSLPLAAEPEEVAEPVEVGSRLVMEPEEAEAGRTGTSPGTAHLVRCRTAAAG
jgi:hypothetical protein